MTTCHRKSCYPCDLLGIFHGEAIHIDNLANRKVILLPRRQEPVFISL